MQGLPQENVVKDIDIDNMESQTNSKPHELARQIVHLTSELDVKTKELEAAKAAGNSHERKYLELERDSTEAASSKGELTRTVANLKAELETLKAAYGNSASERSKTLEEIEELKSRIATGERELADAKQKATQHALEFSTHRDTSAKDILAAQEATKLSKTDHETLKRALEEAKASEAEAQAKHESAEARLKEAKSAHAETVSSHDATKTELEQKLAEINGYEAEKAALLASHESSSNQKEVDLHSVRLKLADSEMKTDASNERALELSKNLESLTKHHEASKTALLAAQAETKRMQETSNTEHKDALEALAKELELSKTNAASLTSDLDAITKDKDGISKALESATAENELLKSGTADSASKHSALKAQLDELQASSADATKSNKTELDAAHTKIAELSAEIEKHTASRGDSDQTISKLRGELEAHSALQTDFEKAQTRIIALQKDVDGHGSSNAELQKQVNELNSIKAELVTAQAKVAELTTLTDSNAKTKSEVQATHDKAVADLTSSHHEKITTTEAALAAATAKHQNIAESLKSKDKEIASAQEDLSSISKELASTEVALKDAQAALEKEKKNSVEELARKGRDAEERATAAELALKTAKGQHEAERASLSAKLTELENDKSRNGNLLKDLVASKHSEASSRATIARLEKELETLRAKPTSNEANVHVSKIPKAVKETDEKPSKSKVNPVTKVDPVVPEAEAPAEEGTSSEHAQVPEPVDPDKA
jgi:chromosome segregation ATPase